MYRGTTPTVMWKITSDIDLDNIVNGEMTFNNSGRLLVKGFSDLIIDNENKTISTKLSQEDTLFFIGNSAEVQLRVRLGDADDTAMATEVKTVPIERILKGGVI